MITDAGLTVSGRAFFTWSTKKKTEDVVRTLYPTATDDTVHTVVYHFLYHNAVVIFISGPDAIERFLTLAGTEISPLQCAEGTIRRTFGLPGSIPTKDLRAYWQNAIHRPKNAEEVAHGLAALQTLLRT